MKRYEEDMMSKGEQVYSYCLGELTQSLQERFAMEIGCTNPQRIALGINATFCLSSA